MEKIEKLQLFLKEKEIDFAFITNPHHVYYFSGFQSDPHERVIAVIIFSQFPPFIFCPQMEVADVKATGWPYDVIGYLDTDNPWDMVTNKIQSRLGTITGVGIEKSHLTVERYEALKSRIPQVIFHGLDDEINNMRVIKDEIERKKLKKAAELADYAIEVGIKEIAVGKTELEIVQKIENKIKELGCKMSFETTVLSGPKSASPHGKTGNRKIQDGDFVLLDLGVIYEGYCSDITRTVAIGEISDEKRKIYEVVKRSNEESIKAIKPGITCRDLDQISRKVIQDAGYGRHYTHRLGHGLGISVHEFPSISGNNELELLPGMVFTVEPGIYKEEIGGVRIEDDVVVTENSAEVLTKYPKELIIIK